MELPKGHATSLYGQPAHTTGMSREPAQALKSSYSLLTRFRLCACPGPDHATERPPFFCPLPHHRPGSLPMPAGGGDSDRGARRGAHGARPSALPQDALAGVQPRAPSPGPLASRLPWLQNGRQSLDLKQTRDQKVL